MPSQIEIVARKIAAAKGTTVPAKLLKDLRAAIKATNATENAPQYRAAAINKYASNELEIDADAVVSKGDDNGAFVAAWVWVPDEELN